MNRKNKAPKQVSVTAAPAQSPEADFDDTIAHNRGSKPLDPAAIPEAPPGFRPTDPDKRSRRLRRLSGGLRAEAVDALREAGKLDLQGDLGRFAPDPKRAAALAARLDANATVVARAQALLDYAKEMDEILLSDALIVLEAEHKQFRNAVDHDASLALRYRGLVQLFDMRSGAIAEGMARQKSRAAESAPKEPPAEAPTG